MTVGFPPAVVGMSARQIFLRLILTHFHQPAICLWRTLELLEMRATAFSAPVLDLGCGNGDIGDLALRSHWPVFGLDRVHSETRAARRRRAYNGLTTADATALPFSGEAFATVVNICVLEHIPDDLGVLREVGRVLKPGGSFVFSTPSVHFEKLLIHSDAPASVEAVNERLGHFHYRSAGEWKALLSDAGMTVEQHRYLLPEASQRLWERLDNLMIARIGGRRVLDIIRALERRSILPKRLWGQSWAHALSRLALSRVEPDAVGGGQLIVAVKEDPDRTVHHSA